MGGGWGSGSASLTAVALARVLSPRAAAAPPACRSTPGRAATTRAAPACVVYARPSAGLGPPWSWSPLVKLGQPGAQQLHRRGGGATVRSIWAGAISTQWVPNTYSTHAWGAKESYRRTTAGLRQTQKRLLLAGGHG